MKYNIKGFMKLNLVVALIMLLGVFFAFNTTAQISDKDWDYMLIREDVVEPSQTADYEASLTDLKTFLSANKHVKFNYYTHLQEDYIFRHVIPVDDIKNLHKGMHHLFSKNVKSDELDLILSDLNDATDAYKYSVVQYRPEFSYVPEGDDWEDSVYRKWGYYSFYPGTEDEVEQVLAAWKSLYQSKEIPTGFRVFSGFIGIEQPSIIFTTWGDNPLDYHTNLEIISAELGEEGAALWMKMMEYVNDVESVEGWYLPQYSHSSK